MEVPPDKNQTDNEGDVGEGESFFLDSNGKPSVYNCKYCPVICEDFFTYLSHSKVCTKNPAGKTDDAGKIKLYPCPTCDRRFTTKSNMYRHMKLHQQGLTQNLECHICEKQFSSSNVLAKHIKSHENTQYCKCHLCNGVFSNTSNLNKHLKTFHGNDTRTINNNKSLDAIDNPNTSFEKLNGHVSDVGYVFSKSGSTYIDLNSTINASINGTSTNPTRSVSSPNISFVNVHPGFENLPANKSVEKQLNSNSGNLEISLNNVDAVSMVKPVTSGIPQVPRKKKICNICGKTFSTSGNLSRHRKIHFTEKPHQCKECNKQFMEKNDLKRHLKTHELKTLTETNICDLDDSNPSGSETNDIEISEFLETSEPKSEENDVDDSNSNIIPTTDPNETKKTHICKLCDKEFLYKSNYLTHLRIHSSEKPFKCSQCNSRFTQSSNLYRHMKLHKTGRPIKVRTVKNEFRISQVLETDESVFRPDLPTEASLDPVMDKIGNDSNRNDFKDSISSLEDDEDVLFKSLISNNDVLPIIQPNPIVDSQDPYHHQGSTEVKMIFQNDGSNKDLDKSDVRSRLDSYLNIGSEESDTKKLDNNSSEFITENREFDGPYNNQIDTPEVHIIDNNGFGDLEDGEMYTIKEESENYCGVVDTNKPNDVTSDHFQEPIPMSSDPHPLTDDVVQPIFIYKTKDNQSDEIVHEDDIIVVNSSQVCNICYEHFATEEELLGHMNMHNGIQGELKKHVCNFCGKTFSTDGNLNRHIKIHSGDKPYHCDICDRHFTQNNDLKRHLKIHERHSNGDKQMIDDKMASSNDNVGCSEEGKIFLCSTCGKQYSSVGNLKRHMKLHIGLKSSFYQVIDKDIELDTSMTENVMSMVCDVADRQSFQADPGMDINGKSGSDDTPTKLNGKYFMCNICRKSYTSLGNLKRHLQLNHSGISESFHDDYEEGNDNGQNVEVVQNKSNLIQEKLTLEPSSCVDNVQPSPTINQKNSLGKRYVCSVCSKHYSTLKSLKRHLKLHVGMKMSEYTIIDRLPLMNNGVRSLGNETGLNPSNVSSGVSNLVNENGETILNGVDGSNYFKSFLCNVCGKYYSTLGNLRRHLKLNHNQGKKLFPVGSNLSSVSDYHTHKANLLQNGSGKEKLSSNGVSDCIKDENTNTDSYFTSTPINSKVDLKAFAISKSIINLNTKTTECHVCSKSFLNRGNLKIHLKLNHGFVDDPANPKALTVMHPSDEGTTASKAVLVDNSINVALSNPVPVLREFSCSICCKSFSSSTKLERHSVLHAEYKSNISSKEMQENGSERPKPVLSCSACGNKYSEMGNLKRHLRLFHCGLDETQTQIVVSPPKKKQFLDSESVKIETQTFPINKSVKSNDSKSFMCNVCSRSFSSLTRLKRHLSLHPGFKVCQYNTDSRDEAILQNMSLEGAQTGNVSPKSISKSPVDPAYISVTADGAKCNLCGKIYSSVGNLKRHIKISHKNDDETLIGTTCNICGRQYSSVGNLKRHIKLNHNTGNVVIDDTTCRICGRQYSSMDNLKRHLKLKHTGSESKDSGECNNISLDKDTADGFNHSQESEELDKLIAEMDSDQTYEFNESLENTRDPCICNVCGKPYSTPGNLRRHMKLHLGLNTDQYKVINRQQYPIFNDYEQSGKSLVETLQSLDTGESPAIDIGGGGGNKSFSCIECGKTYLCLGNLKRHLDTSKCGKKNSNKNKACSEGAKSDKKLNVIEIDKSNDSSQNYLKQSIDLDEKWNIFDQSDNDNIKDTNSNPKLPLVEIGSPIKSDTCVSDADSVETFECTNSNVSGSSLVIDLDGIDESKEPSELSIQHEDDSTQTCNICGNQYTTKAYLEVHMQEQHISKLSSSKVKLSTSNEISSPGPPVKHICPMCTKHFSTGSNLSRHMKIHRGEKPYQCPYCERFFTQSNDLKRHTKTHFFQ